MNILPGTWVVFGIIFIPVYTMLIAWFAGRPRNPKKALMGITYLLGITTALWGGLFLTTVVIGLVFF
ncbi:MAG: hypothetical protein U5K37_12525 [Natrialbaceae archaeon]|nr:hypothetical protein [Natrialbaceae archaeon]